MAGAFWVQQFMVGWLAYELTNSALLTSIAMGLQMAPFLIGGPLGGVFADRFDRRKVLVGISAYQIALTATFMAVILLDLVTINYVFFFALALGISWAISEPVRIAIIPSLVPQNSFVNAFALNTFAFNAGRFAMPAIAGFLVLWLGPGTALGVGVVTLILTLSLLLKIDVHDVHSDCHTKASSRPQGSFLEALRYIKGQPILLAVTLLGLTVPFILVPSISTLLPVYADSVFLVQSDGLGILMAAVGIGGMVGSVLVATAGDVPRGQVMILALLLSAVAAIGFSLTDTYLLALPLLALVFVCIPSFWAIQAAVVQSIVPDHLRGRITSVAPALGGFYPLGSLLAGYLAESYGPQTATLVAGIVYAAAMGLILIHFRTLWGFK